jgi:hypothetical protein
LRTITRLLSGSGSGAALHCWQANTSIGLSVCRSIALVV